MKKENIKNKKIYIVFTFTGTVLATSIRRILGVEYAHTSISLDEDLEELYSFGRLNPYNPVIGGFIQEGIDHGTFFRFKDTTARIYKLYVTEKEYETVVDNIEDFKRTKDIMSFNTLGMITLQMGLNWDRENKYFCSQFVSEMLRRSGIMKFDKPSYLISPLYLLKKIDAKYDIVFEQKLQDYNEWLENKRLRL